MSRVPHVFLLPNLPLSTLPAALYGDGDERWHTVAQVVAQNIARHPGPAAVVLRPSAAPRLAVVGWFGDEEAAQVRLAIDTFTQGLRQLRYVSYEDAEAASGVLATRLRATLSPAELSAAAFAGIPRGGLLVLGMLAYELDLAPHQLGAPASPDAPLVVVDDCFLTGSRAVRFLDEQPPHPDVVLAGLYAHPDLCAALERERPAVRACVTARSLRDHAPTLYGDDYPAWNERWSRRAAGPRHWHGVTDRLCFAWSEPDRVVWNPATQRVERAWTTVPADRCLKTRSQSPPAAPVLVQPPPNGPFAPTPAVVYADLGARTIVAHTGTDTVLPLNGTAAAFWRALIGHGSVAAAERALAADYDVAPDVLADDLRAFVASLVDHDLVAAPLASPPAPAA
jgi:hypothetical protein